jgi:hypothetical protein
MVCLFVSFIKHNSQPDHMDVTQEQQDAIDAVRSGYHVQLEAMPGSGKSAVAYKIVSECDDRTSLILSYNRALNDTTRRHLSTMNLKEGHRCKSFTFHGLASSLTSTVCHTDAHFVQAISTLRTVLPHPSKWAYSDFSLLIIDESQDMRPTLFMMVKELIIYVCQQREALRIVLLGDARQLLYHFYPIGRADARFLTMGHRILANTNKRTWKLLHLTRSFRSTSAVTAFLNCIVPGHVMVPRNTESCEPVTLVICDVNRDVSRLIHEYILGVPHSSVMILAPSVNASSPARRVVRALVRRGFRVHVWRSGSISDTCSQSSESYTTGKIQVKTYCSSKGLESDVIIVLNLRELLGNDMENSAYVALSRSRQRLIVFQDHRTCTMEQLNGLCERMCTDGFKDKLVVRICRTPTYREKADTDTKNVLVSVTTMFDYGSDDFVDEIYNTVTITKCTSPIVESTYENDSKESDTVRTYSVTPIEHSSYADEHNDLNHDTIEDDHVWSAIKNDTLHQKLSGTRDDFIMDTIEPIDVDRCSGTYTGDGCRGKSHQGSLNSNNDDNMNHYPNVQRNASGPGEWYSWCPEDTLNYPNEMPRSETFDMRFDIKNSDDRTVNVLGIVGTVMYTVIEFHFLRRIPARFSVLNTSRSKVVRNMYIDAHKHIKQLGAYDGNIGRLARYVDPICELCIARDAEKCYADKLFELPDASFASCSAMFLRIIRSIQIMEPLIRRVIKPHNNGARHIPATCFHASIRTVVDYVACDVVNTNDKPCRITLYATTFFKYGQHLMIYMPNKFSVDRHDVCIASVLGVAANMSQVHIINPFDGTHIVTDSRLSKGDEYRMTYLTNVVRRHQYREDDLSDTAFISTYEIEHASNVPQLNMKRKHMSSF